MTNSLIQFNLIRPIDTLVSFSKMPGLSSTANAPVRYAVRAVLDQEYRKETMRKASETASLKTGGSYALKTSPGAAQKSGKKSNQKRDFFGRIIESPASGGKDGDEGYDGPSDDKSKAGRKVWVTFHEGFSNAVRKPISIGELLSGL